jgi:cytochrome d ubiquinol oxidase subunit I
MLKKYTPNVVDATDAQIRQAAADTIPKVAPLFWSFRGMVFLGFLFLFIFGAAVYFMVRRNLAPQRWLLKLCVLAIPLPWVAAELGWVVAEYGRQPWTIAGVLPTHLSASTLSAGSLWFSLAGFLGFYTLLLVVEMGLMVKYARLGPASLHTGRYHGETPLSRADDHAAAA